MNIDLKRVEFVITWDCTGRCKHCSLGEPKNTGAHIEYAKLAGVLMRLASLYSIESVMCFGGEPLLHPIEVFAILDEAKRTGIPRRQIITNGFFGHNSDRIKDTARQCNEFATDVLLSVDAFHQETIPLKPVREFAGQLNRVRLHPAWLVNENDDNPYNARTREILAQFDGMPVSSGNEIFPAGNALKHLAEYFDGSSPPNPYKQSPDRVTTISIRPNGDIMAAGQIIGNAYEENLCFTSSLSPLAG